jgi:hypothetical protein
MIAPKIKEVFYRRTVYKVPIDDVRYVDGCDVAKLPNETFVFWNDERKAWQPATPLMIELFTGKKVVQVDIDGVLYPALSFVNENETIEEEKVSSGRIDFVIKFNKDKNAWQLVPPNTKTHEDFLKKKNEI